MGASHFLEVRALVVLPRRTRPGVWTYMSPNRAPSQSPTLSRDCGTTLGWPANTKATPTGLRLLSRTCRSLFVNWFRPHEIERGHNPGGVESSFVPSTQSRRFAPTLGSVSERRWRSELSKRDRMSKAQPRAKARYLFTAVVARANGVWTSVRRKVEERADLEISKRRSAVPVFLRDKSRAPVLPRVCALNTYKARGYPHAVAPRLMAEIPFLTYITLPCIELLCYSQISSSLAPRD